MKALFKSKSFAREKSGGYIMIINTLLFIAIFFVLLVGTANSLISHYGATRGLTYSKQAYLTAHSAADEALYRLKNGLSIPSTLNVTLGSSTADITVVASGVARTITISSSDNSFQRQLRIHLNLGTGVSFHYGIQSGNGGFVLQNSSSVTGNVFSGGPVNGSGNTIYGDLISSGSSGLINGIHATGTAYAHTIQNSTVDKDAYYTTISGTTVSGSGTCAGNSHCHPNSADQPIVPLPISDAQIAQWESNAAVNTATCTSGSYSPENNTTLGPIKVPCNLSIKNSTITIGGQVWVTGNIDIKGSTVLMASNLANQNVSIIADDPANQSTKDIISTDTSTTFYAAGCPSACVSGAYIFLISQNNSAETGGSTDAISLGQSSSGLIAYAAHGQITIGQSVSLKEVTAYKIVLQNTANVVYDTGLPNTLFEAGPGGGYDIADWLEI